MSRRKKVGVAPVSDGGAERLARASIHLELEPRVDTINSTREFVTSFYDRLLGDPDTSSRVALTAHELMENALKYSVDGRATVDVGLGRRQGKSFIRIRMRNRAARASVAALRSVVDALHAAPDATALYYQMMERSAGLAEGSGLGLARIQAEANMTLGYRVQGDQVTVTAETAVTLGDR